jgi:hypothetical protein
MKSASQRQDCGPAGPSSFGQHRAEAAKLTRVERDAQQPIEMEASAPAIQRMTEIAARARITPPGPHSQENATEGQKAPFRNELIRGERSDPPNFLANTDFRLC